MRKRGIFSTKITHFLFYGPLFTIFVSMKRMLLTLFALATFTLVEAQESALPTIDAQTLGMGGVSMTSTSDAHALFNNAAMASFSLFPAKLSTSYYGQADFDYYGISGYWRFNPNNTLQLGWRQYLREKGNNDSALDVGYGRRLGERTSLAVTGRYLMLKRYEEKSEALAVDLAAAYVQPLTDWKHYSTLRLGAKLSNLGGFLGHSELDLPMEVKAGAALETFFSDQHQLTVGADLGYYFTPSDVRGFQAALGAEYNLMQLIQLRAGYHVGERKDYYPSFFSLGAGIRILHIRVDFAYLIAEKESLLRNTYSISFGLDF